MRTLIALALLTTSAYAVNRGEWDYLDQSLKDWFKGLKNSEGHVCCDISDGHAAKWKRDSEGKFWVKLEETWYEVPDNTILKRTPNKMGEAIVWYGWKYYSFNGNKDFQIRCFLPESEV